MRITIASDRCCRLRPGTWQRFTNAAATLQFVTLRKITHTARNQIPRIDIQKSAAATDLKLDFPRFLGNCFTCGHARATRLCSDLAEQRINLRSQPIGTHSTFRMGSRSEYQRGWFSQRQTLSRGAGRHHASRYSVIHSLKAKA